MTMLRDLSTEISFPEYGDGTADCISFLRELSVFALLDDDALATLAAQFVVEQFSEDEVIFLSGDPSDALYFVQQGRVALFESTVGKPTRLLAHVGPGDMFGEMGLLEKCARTASARVTKQANLLKLSKNDFTELVATNPSLVLQFTLEALSRFSANISRLLAPQCRQDPRVYLAQKLRLEWGQEPSQQVSLENLSAGGMCLRGLTCPVAQDESFSGILSQLNGQELLRFKGRVAWRAHRAMGIAFTDLTRDHHSRIQEVLRKVLPANQSGQ